MSFVEARKLVAGDNPFIGLRPFGIADADVFFGREAQVAQLLERLRGTRFVAAVGASGSGKSSLVLAGLIPALERGALDRARPNWRVAVMRPGTAPVEALATVLARTAVLGEQADDPALPRARILNRLQSSERGLVEAVAHGRLRDDENLLVVVDQFEELFRYGAAADPRAQANEAAAFVKLLLTATASTDLPIYVAIALRSDYIGDCAQFRGLPEAINDGVFLVPRLTREELQRSIEEPVRGQGERIAPQLVARLLADAGSDADQLPVLEHALMRTWDAWELDHAAGEPLDVRHYESIGTMRGALSKHANHLYDSLEPQLRRVAEKLFRCLTAREGDGHGIRRPTAFGTVCAITRASPADVERVFRIFAAPGVSFLIASGPLSNPKATLDISHESLTRLWNRLRAWVDDEAESAKTYRKLVDDATNERAHWIDPELAVGQAWLAKKRTSINPAWAARYDDALATLPDDEALQSPAARTRFDAALAFLAASAAAPRRRLRTIAASVGVFFIVAAVLAVTAAFEHAKAGAAQRTAAVARNSAVAAEGRARLRSDEALRARAEAISASLKDHADRLQAAQDLDAARKKVALADARLARAQALAKIGSNAQTTQRLQPAAVAASTTATARASATPSAAATPANRQDNAAAASEPACSRALNDEQRASQSTISSIASYDASIAGLAENARCAENAKQVVNEGYLRSSLAAAEHALKLGDWQAELKRADALLARCESLAALRGTSVSADCLAQRRFNAGAAAQWNAESPRPASPSPSPSAPPSPSASRPPARSPSPSPSPTVRR